MNLLQSDRSNPSGCAGASPLVFLGNVPFASNWQRCQQLAICMAADRDVIYVDPNHSFLQCLRRRMAAPSETWHLPQRLSLYRPSYGLPLGRSVGLFNRYNCARMVAGLRRRLEAVGCDGPSALVATYPDQLDSLRLLGNVPLVYDLMDEPELFLNWRQKKRFRRLHDELLERADLLITSSGVLLERYGGRARRAVCVTNGVRESLLADLKTALPTTVLARLPQPRLGYIGMIAHWFDFEAVAAMARAVPHGTVILVGPCETRMPRLPANVVWVGSVPHLELAPVLRAFDVGLIPFRSGSAIDAINPVKLYEYLAAGLPVLASRFTEIVTFDKLVTIYESSADAGSAARSLLARSCSPAERRSRQAVAACHSWTAKAKQFLQALDDVILPATRRAA